MENKEKKAASNEISFAVFRGLDLSCLLLCFLILSLAFSTVCGFVYACIPTGKDL
jgi:hypothetical protein